MRLFSTACIVSSQGFKWPATVGSPGNMRKLISIWVFIYLLSIYPPVVLKVLFLIRHNTHTPVGKYLVYGVNELTEVKKILKPFAESIFLRFDGIKLMSLQTLKIEFFQNGFHNFRSLVCTIIQKNKIYLFTFNS